MKSPQRDNQKVGELRERLEQAAAGNENLTPLFIECFENEMTLGEVCGTLRSVWGEHNPQTVL